MKWYKKAGFSLVARDSLFWALQWLVSQETINQLMIGTVVFNHQIADTAKDSGWFWKEDIPNIDEADTVPSAGIVLKTRICSERDISDILISILKIWVFRGVGEAGYFADMTGETLSWSIKNDYAEEVCD